MTENCIAGVDISEINEGPKTREKNVYEKLWAAGSGICSNDDGAGGGGEWVAKVGRL